ncbi:unnamed protein product [marine sediment metagenome]|uniref:Uncharacterized protein n=1 Tax=marine sediment metagenome TaxID=412755 RepID=X1C5S4_9ZZZZ
MSKLSDAQTKLITKLNLALDNKYKIYTKIKADGYDSPYIVLNKYYHISNPDTTTNSKQLGFYFEALIGINYNSGCVSDDDDNGDTIESELETDIETIFALALGVKESEIDISDDSNQDGSTKVSIFTLIL